MSQFFAHIFQSYIIAHGAIAIFFVGVMEDILFFVPSSLVFMGAGFVMVGSGAGFWRALGIVALHIGMPAAVGVTAGALVVYGIVYKLGKPVVLQYGKYLGVSWEEIEQVRRRFAKGYSDELVLFIMRAVPVFPLSIASILSGIVRLPWKEFVAMTLYGVFIRVTVSAMIGWRVGKAYVEYAEKFAVVERYGAAVILMAIAVFLVWHLHRHRRGRVESKM